jgi:hypothetical protein
MSNEKIREDQFTQNLTNVTEALKNLHTVDDD